MLKGMLKRQNKIKYNFSLMLEGKLGTFYFRGKTFYFENFVIRISFVSLKISFISIGKFPFSFFYMFQLWVDIELDGIVSLIPGKYNLIIYLLVFYLGFLHLYSWVRMADNIPFSYCTCHILVSRVILVL